MTIASPISPRGTRSFDQQAGPVTGVDLTELGHLLDGWRDEVDPRDLMAAVVRAVAADIEQPEPKAFGDAERLAPEQELELIDLIAGNASPDLLGPVWESLLLVHDRRAQGAHFTPREVADRLAGLVLDRIEPSDKPPTVWDPSAGGGAFLLAIARRLASTARYDAEAIVERLYATDVDSVALDVCRATLELWANSGTQPSTACVDALLDLPTDWPTDFDVVIGNPPFLGQLTTDTARSSSRQARLRDRYPEVTTGYVDDAGLFLELGLSRLTDRGALGLVLPSSLLGARDASSVRTRAMSTASLHTLWIDRQQSFSASVDVVAPVLVRRTNDDADQHTAVNVVVGDRFVGAVELADRTNWSPLMAHGLGLPTVSISRSRHRLSELAEITAGFRQHFYGITDAVRESTGRPDSTPLVTAGAIEPFMLQWAKRGVRFAGNSWDAPELEVSAIVDQSVRAWFEARKVPKLLLASQTKIVEAIADPDGKLMPSVPVVTMEPSDSDMLWHLAAALSAPAVSVIMISDAAGTGLSRDAVRVSAKKLSDVPTPPNQSEWDEGAKWAEAAQGASSAGKVDDYVEAMWHLGHAMDRAYGVNDAIGAWWWERLRLPVGSSWQAY